MWKIVTLVPEIKLSPLDGISLNRMLWKKNSDEWKFRQGELVTGRNLFILVSFLVPGWMMVRYTLWCHGAGLDDLSAVADSTTEHHAEDHPDDLQRGELILRQQQMWIIIPPLKKLCFQCLTHHDASDADAHVPDDVEFMIKEVLDPQFTVLQSKSMSHAEMDIRTVAKWRTISGTSSLSWPTYLGVCGISTGARGGSTAVQLIAW